MYESSEERTRYFIQYAIPPDKQKQAFKRNKKALSGEGTTWEVTDRGLHVVRKPLVRGRFKTVHYRSIGITRGDLRMVMHDRHLTAATVAFIIGKPKNTVMEWVKHEGENDPGHVIPMTSEQLKKVYDFVPWYLRADKESPH